MKKFLLALIIAIFVCSLFAARKALVIGNAAYESKPLRNTINDAEDIAAALRKLDFVVDFRTDLTLIDMTRAILQFTNSLDSIDEAVFYFAGHGVQIDGNNYLVPVYPIIVDEVSAKHHTYNCLELLERIKRPKVAIVFLDACRNNPFSWTRSLGTGLARMDKHFANQCIIFSSEADGVALDGGENDRNSPFTMAVKRYIDKPMDFTNMFRKIRSEVATLTENFQVPYKYGDLEEEYYFAPPVMETIQSKEIEEMKPVVVVPKPLPTPIPEPPAPKIILDRGSIEVYSNMDGEVYINDDSVPLTTIKKNATVIIPKLIIGECKVTIKTEKAEKSQEIEVKKDSVQKLDFAFPVVAVSNKMVTLPDASYNMGSKKLSEKPIHSVSLSSFMICQHEVTIGEFRSFVKASAYLSTAEIGDGSVIWDRTKKEWRNYRKAYWDDPGYLTTENHPVSCVSWFDAIAYCNWRSTAEGLEPCYSIKGNFNPAYWSKGTVNCNFDANGYRLPSEAEWEYAAKGNSSSFTYSGANQLEEVATCVLNSKLQAKEVGSHKANTFGLYDLSGNVNEWCWDWFDPGYYSRSPQHNPAGPVSGSFKIIRGGSWYDNEKKCRLTYRQSGNPHTSESGIGFRVARTVKNDD